jgi:hypothetical protein
MSFILALIILIPFDCASSNETDSLFISKEVFLAKVSKLDFETMFYSNGFKEARKLFDQVYISDKEEIDIPLLKLYTARLREINEKYFNVKGEDLQNSFCATTGRFFLQQSKHNS